MKKCSTSLIIRKCQSEPQGDSNSHLSGWLLAKNRRPQMLGRRWRNGNPCTLSVGIWDGVVTVGNSIEGPLKRGRAHDPAIPQLGIYPKRTEARISKNYEHSHVHCSTAYKSTLWDVLSHTLVFITFTTFKWNNEDKDYNSIDKTLRRRAHDLFH